MGDIFDYPSMKETKKEGSGEQEQTSEFNLSPDEQGSDKEKGKVRPERGSIMKDVARFGICSLEDGKKILKGLSTEDARYEYQKLKIKQIPAGNLFVKSEPDVIRRGV
ncbi:hypothetical protein ES702_04083 [subsurface metagenome]